MRPDAHRFWQSFGGPRLLALLALAIAGIVIVAALAFAPHPPAAGFDSAPATVVEGRPLGNLSSGFFGVNVQEVAVGGPALAARVNATPLTLFRFTPNGEATDQIAGLTYNSSGFAGPTLGFTDAEFVAWCESLHCRSEMMVPAEIDNTAIAVATVAYVEGTLGFHPTYWAIGNEPQQWTHFGIPWLDWRTSDSSTPSPLQYATEVLAYAQALRAFDPSIQLIGLESSVGGGQAKAWLQNVSAVAGPYLAAVAYHAYPGGNGSAPGSLAQFYSDLQNPNSFPGNYPASVGIVRAACPGCHLQVFVDEFDGALGGEFKKDLVSYADAVIVAAGLIQAAREGVPHVLYFDLADLDPNLPYGMLLSGGAPRPTYLLYSEFLANLTLGQVHSSSLAGAGGGNYSLYVTSPSSASLFVVDTNLTEGIRLSLPTAFLHVPGGTVWSWAPGEASPVVQPFPDHPLAPTWTVPPQGMLLVTLPI